MCIHFLKNVHCVSSDINIHVYMIHVYFLFIYSMYTIFSFIHIQDISYIIYIYVYLFTMYKYMF